MQPSPAAQAAGFRLQVSASAPRLLSTVYLHIVVGRKQTEDALDTTVSPEWENRFSLARSSLYTLHWRRCSSASRSILNVNWINWMDGLIVSLLHLFSVSRSFVLAKPLFSLTEFQCACPESRLCPLP
jgi:hypothetical protein